MNPSDKIKGGAEAEYRALEYLRQKGYRILDRNVNYPKVGEIDLVAEMGDTLVFVEVRYRATKDFGDPIESVTNSKVKKLLRAAERYLAALPVKFESVRFDLIAVDDCGIDHVEDAFYGYWH